MSSLRNSSQRARLLVERLEDRLTPAVQAVFNAGILTVVGDSGNNDIVVGADANGNLRVTEQGQAVAIRVLSGQATLATTRLVSIDGRNGNDSLRTENTLNIVSNGALAAAPDAILLGGNGKDTLKVGHGGIVGGLAGVVDGVVVGPVVGNAYMDGGNGDDSLISGFGNDVMFGGNGNDSYLWPPGTLTDVWDGGNGFDTATIIGNDTFLSPDPAGDVFQLSADGTRVLFQRLNLIQFAVDIGTTEAIVLKPGAGDDTVLVQDLTGVKHLKAVLVDAGDGNDVIDASAQQNKHVSLLANGGAGNDVIKGGAGCDVLYGDEGDDQLEGNAGRDVLVGGEGDDELDGGDDKVADILIGGDGADTFSKRKKDNILDFSADEGDILVTL